MVFWGGFAAISLLSLLPGICSAQTSASLLAGVGIPTGDLAEAVGSSPGVGAEWNYHFDETWALAVTGLYFPSFKAKSGVEESRSGTKPPATLTPPGAGDPTSYNYSYAKSGVDGNAKALTVTAGMKMTTREAPARVSLGAGGGVTQWTTPPYYYVVEYFYANWVGAPLNQWLPNPPISDRVDSSASGQSKAYGTANVTLGFLLAMGESLSLGLDGRYYAIFAEDETVSLIAPTVKLVWRFGGSSGGTSAYRGYEDDEYRPPKRKRKQEVESYDGGSDGEDYLPRRGRKRKAQEGGRRTRPEPSDEGSSTIPFVIH